MQSRPYNLPSLNALASFEAAARHVSFKAAARELNVTPAAISHQVKALEADLAQALFLRHQRGVDLTEAGAYLMVALQRGFEGISDAANQLRRRADSTAVTIQATTAVSSLWLTPRLGRFWRSHGHIAVTQHIADLPLADSSDLSIHYGDITRDRGDCRPLFQDRIMAVASPGFAADHNVTMLDDLAHLPLIHLNAEVSNWTSWRDWCAELGYHGPLGEGLRVNNYVIALQAAQDDMGIVLGWERLVGQMVTSGTLVQILPHSIASPLDFYIRARPNAPARARFLRDWLAENAS